MKVLLTSLGISTAIVAALVVATGVCHIDATAVLGFIGGCAIGSWSYDLSKRIHGCEP